MSALPAAPRAQPLAVKVVSRLRTAGCAATATWLYQRALHRTYENTFFLKPLFFFRFRGRRYRYFCHPYNCAWGNERSAEVPIAAGLVARYRGRRILEVGNVLSHYYPVSHDIVDKYETAPGVRNEDAVSVAAAAPYDLIVSISTIEHVGFDEMPQDPDKAARALAHLRSLLAPGGVLCMTFALGYNHHLDRQFIAGALPLDHYAFLRRYSWFNFWKETRAPKPDTVRYGFPYPCGNWLAVGWCGKDDSL